MEYASSRRNLQHETLTTVRLNRITFSDLMQALIKGLDDFLHKPSHILMLVVLYPIFGLVAAMMAAGQNFTHLIFPLVSGFALVGPVAAVALYEHSRRREQSLTLSWRSAFSFLKTPARGPLFHLSVLLGLIYFAWIGAAHLVYGLVYESTAATSPLAFIEEVLTTSKGMGLLFVGGGVGFVFALLVLMVSAVSFPMVLDREVSAWTAIKTSMSVFASNPFQMLAWGAMISIGLLIGSLPFLAGLALVMPIFGHATWHLYRKTVG